jgi:hypothetical protein
MCAGSVMGWPIHKIHRKYAFVLQYKEERRRLPHETSLDGQTLAFPPFCPLPMAAEVVCQPGVPSDVCLLSADGVRLRVHKQVLACACGTFEGALDAELSGGELPVLRRRSSCRQAGYVWRRR